MSLVLLCLAIYANAFDTGFALDNRQLILQDPRVHAWTGANLSLIFNHTYWWPYGESGLYRPLTTLSYLFNFAVLGNADRPAGYHWFNLLFHAVNVLLAWRLCLRATADRWIAAVAASVWASLPLSTEAVTNIAGRADLMAATGALVAVLVYFNAREHGWTRPARTFILLVGTGLAVVLGTLAKESAAATLAVLLAIEVLWWDRSYSTRVLSTAAAAVALPLLWWAWQRTIVLSASSTAEFPFTDNPIVGAPFGLRVLTAAQVMWRYVSLLVWPAHLSNDYSYAQIPLARGTVVEWLGCALLAGGGAAALWQARRNRPILFFAFFSLIMFLPASNLLFATGTIMGERLMYLPSLGLAALLAIGLRALATNASRRLVTTCIAAVLVSACGIRTWARNPDWTNDLTLWRSAVAAAPASAKAHRALAEALYDSDPSHANIDEVIAEADRGVALLEALPDELNAYQAFRQAGAYYLDKANAVSTPASKTNPDAQRLYSRALHLLDRAVLIARAGATRMPNGSMEPEADAQRLRAATLLGLENPSLALVAANRSRELQPLHPLAYRLAAASLLGLNRTEEAATTFLTGSIVSGDPALGREAMSLYSSGLDPDGCAVSGSGSTAALNPHCPIVARHSCIASGAAFRILRDAGLTGRADQVRSTAITTLGCITKLMDGPGSPEP